MSTRWHCDNCGAICDSPEDVGVLVYRTSLGLVEKPGHAGEICRVCASAALESLPPLQTLPPPVPLPAPAPKSAVVPWPGGMRDLGPSYESALKDYLRRAT